MGKSTSVILKSEVVLVHFGKIKLEIASWFVKFDSKFEAKFILSSCASILASILLPYYTNFSSGVENVD